MDLSGPKKLYFSISEVSGLTGVKPHILRFWEKEFSVLRPRKNRSGNRSYRERDIRVVLAIKHLLYVEKYTIKGASEHLRRDRSLADGMDVEAGAGGKASTETPVRVSDPAQADSSPLSLSQEVPSASPYPLRDPLKMDALLKDLRKDLAGLLEILDGRK